MLAKEKELLSSTVQEEGCHGFSFHYCTLLLCAQELLYLSIKFLNNIWVLAELKITPGQSILVVSHSRLGGEDRRERQRERERTASTDVG